MITGSATSNVLTFTKGDGSTFNLTVATGSATTVDTGSLLVTASISNATTTFTKGDGSTFSITANNVVNANSASVATTATSASYAQNASTADSATTSTTASYVATAVLTGSVISNTLTFTKFDGSTFALTVDTGSAVTTPTGSLLVTASISNATTTYTKGDGSTFALVTNNVQNASTASIATSASFASTATSSSYALTASFTPNALVTASVSSNIITFTKGDGTTFPITVNTGSGGGSGSAFPFTGSAQITGSLSVTGSYLRLSGSFSGSVIDNITDTFTGSAPIEHVISLTQAQYNTISSSADPNTLYYITDAAEIINTGSFYVSSSITNATITFNQGDGSTEAVTVNNVSNASTASIATSASFAQNASTADSATSASFATNANTATSASFASTAISSSYALTASFAQNVTPINTGSFVTTASISNADITFTKADASTFSITVNNVSNASTASIATSASFAISATSSSHALFADNAGAASTAISSSHALNADNSISASFASTASFTTNALSSSFASTASFAPNIYNSNGDLTGNRVVTFQGNNLDFDMTNGESFTIDTTALGSIEFTNLTEASQSKVVGYNSTTGQLTAMNTSSFIGPPGPSGSTFPFTGSAAITGSLVITGSVRGNVSALSISSNTASLDLLNGNFYTLTLVSGSDTFINPSNILPGQTINLLVNTTGSGTVSFPSSVKQVSGSLYIPTTTTSTDIITFISFDSSSLFLSNVKNLV
jgi:hypothetical protein